MSTALADSSILIVNAPGLTIGGTARSAKTKIIRKGYLSRFEIKKELKEYDLLIAHHQPTRFDAIRIADAARKHIATLPVVITGAGNALQTPVEESARGALILRGPMRADYVDELIDYAQRRTDQQPDTREQSLNTSTAYISPKGLEHSRIEFPESIDSRNVDRIRQTIFMQMATNGGLRSRLILDFGTVRWIDSEGVRMLEAMTREFRGRGYKSIEATDASPVIRCSLQNTILVRLFELESRTEASGSS